MQIISSYRDPAICSKTCLGTCDGSSNFHTGLSTNILRDKSSTSRKATRREQAGNLLVNLFYVFFQQQLVFNLPNPAFLRFMVLD